jgi:hypothetical protein
MSMMTIWEANPRMRRENANAVPTKPAPTTTIFGPSTLCPDKLIPHNLSDAQAIMFFQSSIAHA